MRTSHSVLSTCKSLDVMIDTFLAVMSTLPEILPFLESGCVPSVILIVSCQVVLSRGRS